MTMKMSFLSIYNCIIYVAFSLIIHLLLKLSNYILLNQYISMINKVNYFIILYHEYNIMLHKIDEIYIFKNFEMFF